jgi:hypothetical protein
MWDRVNGFKALVTNTVCSATVMCYASFPLIYIYVSCCSHFPHVDFNVEHSRTTFSAFLSFLPSFLPLWSFYALSAKWYIHSEQFVCICLTVKQLTVCSTIGVKIAISTLFCSLIIWKYGKVEIFGNNSNIKLQPRKIKSRLILLNACYRSIHSPFSFRLFSNILQVKYIKP